MNKQNFTIVSFILVFVVLCTIEAVPARGCNTTVIANDLPDVEHIKYRDEYSFIGRISDNLPKLEITVADTGIYSGNSQRENVLSVTITAQDNSFSQQLLYASLESPSEEPNLLFAQFIDMNCDGYLDLSLLTVAGAENVYSTFALWNKKANRFDPVITIQPWLTDVQHFSDERVQLELCNYRLLPESGQIYSETINGSRYKTCTVYRWTDEYTLCEDSIATIYPAQDGMVGEKLEILRNDVILGWNQQYSADWYYGKERVEKERGDSLDYVMFGDAATVPIIMHVANVDWVNVRLEDQRESIAVAKLKAGCSVQVLKTGCGENGGWIRIWYTSEEGKGYTGYVWHSYLE